MKFGKKLRAHVEESYEEWRPNFMNYKTLKKCIIPRNSTVTDTFNSKDSDSNEFDGVIGSTIVPSHTSDPEVDDDVLSNVYAVHQAERLHAEFFTSFRREVDKVNDFFLDKQEDYIIRHQQLSKRVSDMLRPANATRQQINNLRARLTNFHGELVVLENFSTVNYTGFRKILKKHDKKTGFNIQHVYLNTVLLTPFFLSDTIRKLILSTEKLLSRLNTVVKFRRPSSQSIICASSPPPAKFKPLASAPWSIPLLPSPPRPNNTFVVPRSALWRLYRDARVHASQMLRDKAPSSRLIALADAIVPEEIGITPTFLAQICSPSVYVFASSDVLSIGFIALPSLTSLHVSTTACKRSMVLRNVCGRAQLRLFRPHHRNDAAFNQRSSKSCKENHISSLMLQLDRFATTTGPWPAIVYPQNTLLEWSAISPVALFFVAAPPFDEHGFPKFVLHNHGDSFIATKDEANSLPLKKVIC